MRVIALPKTRFKKETVKIVEEILDDVLLGTSLTLLFWRL